MPVPEIIRKYAPKLDARTVMDVYSCDSFVKYSLNSYIEYLSDAQKKYKELSEDILEDINAIINKE